MYKVPEFITATEQKALVKWYEKKVKEMKLGVNVPRPDICDDPEPGWLVVDDHHPIVKVIERRINNHFGDVKSVNGKGVHQIVANVMPKGASIKPHYDRYDLSPVDDPMTNIDDGYDIIRFNVLLQSAKRGGELHINNEAMVTSDRELMVYKASHDLHEVTENTGNRARILLLFTRVDKTDEKWLEDKV